MKYKHILICRNSLTGIGGAERVLLEQSEALVRLNIQCSVVLFTANRNLLNLFHKKVNVIILGESKYDDIIFVRKVYRLKNTIKSIEPDLVIALQSLSDFIRVALIGSNIKYILYKYTSIFYLANDTMKYSFLHKNVFDKIRNSMPAYIESVPEAWQPNLKYFILNEYYSLRDFFGTRGADKVFTLTSRSAWELKNLYNIDPIIWTPGHSFSESKLASNIELNEFRKRYKIKDKCKIILSVNRLEYRKRVDLALEGFYKYHSLYNNNSILIIVGIGECENELKIKVKSYGIESFVKFVGLISDDDLKLFYQVSDVCVSMIWGTWAISVIEPLLYNKPQIISDEIPDLLSEIKNLFKSPLNSSDVAQTINDAISSPAFNSAEIMKKKLNWRAVSKNILSICSE